MVTDRIRNRLVQFENGPKSNNYSRFPEPNRLAGPGTPYGWDSGPQVFDEDDPAIQGYRPNAGWGELVGSRIEQGTVDGVSGYDADLWGLVFGYDGALNATTRAGVAFGYSNTDIDDTDLMAANSTVLNSYLGIVYGMWKPGPFYLNGTLGLGLHRGMTSTRRNLGSRCRRLPSPRHRPGSVLVQPTVLSGPVGHTAASRPAHGHLSADTRDRSTGSRSWRPRNTPIARIGQAVIR